DEDYWKYNEESEEKSIISVHDFDVSEILPRRGKRLICDHCQPYRSAGTSPDEWI
ncbi:hypothetical protein NPIL_603251, partial [Nephila pilipes]